MLVYKRSKFPNHALPAFHCKIPPLHNNSFGGHRSVKKASFAKYSDTLTVIVVRPIKK